MRVSEFILPLKSLLFSLLSSERVVQYLLSFDLLSFARVIRKPVASGYQVCLSRNGRSETKGSVRGPSPTTKGPNPESLPIRGSWGTHEQGCACFEIHDEAPKVTHHHHHHNHHHHHHYHHHQQPPPPIQTVPNNNQPSLTQHGPDQPSPTQPSPV